ncbi:unnamed protein product [Rotaria sp. Silwood2]|nr:unnamed protein product [Rotaria sp. Silwood2]CAF4593874.1 unnamed protein product [Rotaria sp. Silwood2]
MSIAHDSGLFFRLDHVAQDEELPKERNIDFCELLHFYIECAGDFAYRAAILLAHDFEKNYRTLFESVSEFLDSYLCGVNNNINSIPLKVIESILKLTCNLSDKINLIPMLCKVGFAEKTVQWVNTRTFQHNMDALGESIFKIIHNISRDKMGLNKLRKENAFKALMTYKNSVDSNDDQDLKSSFLMALVGQTVEDQQSEQNKELLLSAVKEFYRYCEQAATATDLRYKGCHLSEILEVIHRAFSNRGVINDILGNFRNNETKPIEFFAKLLSSFYGALLDQHADELDKRAAKFVLKILSQISNHLEYLKVLLKIPEICVIIESLSKRPKQDDAKRIWSNFQLARSPSQVKREKSSTIYISYNSLDQEFCKSFVDALRNKVTKPIWVDYEHVESWDDVWEYAAPAIKSAAEIIVLISTAYVESIEKFQEISYARSTDIFRNRCSRIIGVHCETDFMNKSWLDGWIPSEYMFFYEKSSDKIASQVSYLIERPQQLFSACCPCFTKRSASGMVTKKQTRF